MSPRFGALEVRLVPEFPSDPSAVIENEDPSPSVAKSHRERAYCDGCRGTASGFCVQLPEDTRVLSSSEVPQPFNTQRDFLSSIGICDQCGDIELGLLCCAIPCVLISSPL